MAFQEGTDTLICQHCGAKHEGRWYRLPMKDWHSVCCHACKEVLSQGNAVKEYFEVRLIE